MADEGLKQSVLFVVTYRQALVAGCISCCSGAKHEGCQTTASNARPVPAHRPYFGVLSPALRQRGGAYELLYHHVRAAYRAVLGQVR